MSPPLPNYLKTHRKKAGFSQNDIAYLFGKKSGSYVSRFEQRKVDPDLCTSLSYQIFFNTPVEELFAGMHYQARLDLLDRIAKLLTLLEKKGGSPKIQRRIDCLERVARRIAQSNHKEI